MSGMGNDAFSVNARGVLGTADTLRTIGDNHVGLDAEGRQARATTGSAIGRFFSRVASFFSGNASRNNQRVIDAMARQLAETSSLGRQYADIFTARAAAVLTGRPLTGRTVARVLDETVAQARADFAKKSRVDELLASFVNERSPDSSSFDVMRQPWSAPAVSFVNRYTLIFFDSDDSDDSDDFDYDEIRSEFDALRARVNEELGLRREQRLALKGQDREELSGAIKEILMRNAELGGNPSMQDVQRAARSVFRREALIRSAMSGSEEALTDMLDQVNDELGLTGEQRLAPTGQEREELCEIIKETLTRSAESGGSMDMREILLPARDVLRQKALARFAMNGPEEALTTLLAQVNDELGLTGEQRLTLTDQDREKLCETIKETLMQNAESGGNMDMWEILLPVRDVLREEALVRFATNGPEEALTNLLAQVNDELGLPGEQRLTLTDQDREKLCETITETLMRNATLGGNMDMREILRPVHDELRKKALVKFAMNGVEEALRQEYTRYGLEEALRSGGNVHSRARIEEKGLDKIKTIVNQTITESETLESVKAKMSSLVSITARAMREVVIGAMLERASLWGVYADVATAADIGYESGSRIGYNDFRSRNLRKEISREVQRELMTTDFSEPLNSDAVKARYVRHLERYFDEFKAALPTIDGRDRNFVARAFRTEAPAFSSPALLRFSVDFSEEAAQAILAWKDITDVAELRDRIGKFAEGCMKTFKHLPAGEHDDPKAAISFAFALAIRRLNAGGAVNLTPLMTAKDSPFVVLARQLLKTEPGQSGQSGAESDFNALFLLREIVDAAMPTINLMHVHSDDPDGVVDLRDDFAARPPVAAR